MANINRETVLEARLSPGAVSPLSELTITEDLVKIINELRNRLKTLRQKECKWIRDGAITREASRKLHVRQNTRQLMKELQNFTTLSVKHQKWYFNLMAKAQMSFEDEPLGRGSLTGLMLNHLNTFIYLANYYSAIPSANLYAEAVGLTPSVSGILLSMTPLAAILSAVVYSDWSNKSFKMTMLTSTILLLLGNLLYASAYQYHDPKRLFLGRLLIGLGGNRAANRRYIADFSNKKSRTMNSITFVAISGLGQAIGPFVQTLCNFLPHGIVIKGHSINSLTAPGWLFTIVWAGFLVITLVFFREPTRIYGEKPSPLFEPLLGDDDQKEHESSSMIYNFQELLGAGMCLLVYAALKEVQEATQTAAPIVTESVFGWGEDGVASLLTTIGLLVIPFNFLVGYMSTYTSSSNLQKVFLFGLFLGCLCTINFEFIHSGLPYSLTQYLVGVVLIFGSAQVLEGVNMSLLSEAMPKTYSKGMFNTGFLSTEFGTFGRVIGAALITVAGSVVDARGLNNCVMVPNALILAVLLGFIVSQSIKKPPVIEITEQDRLASMMDKSFQTIGPTPFSNVHSNQDLLFGDLQLHGRIGGHSALNSIEFHRPGSNYVPGNATATQGSFKYPGSPANTLEFLEG